MPSDISHLPARGSGLRRSSVLPGASPITPPPSRSRLRDEARPHASFLPPTPPLLSSSCSPFVDSWLLQAAQLCRPSGSEATPLLHVRKPRLRGSPQRRLLALPLLRRGYREWGVALAFHQRHNGSQLSSRAFLSLPHPAALGQDVQWLPCRGRAWGHVLWRSNLRGSWTRRHRA